MDVFIAVIATAGLLISLYNVQTNRKNYDKIKELEEKVSDSEKLLQLKNQFGFFARKRNE